MREIYLHKELRSQARNNVQIAQVERPKFNIGGEVLLGLYLEEFSMEEFQNLPPYQEDMTIQDLPFDGDADLVGGFDV